MIGKLNPEIKKSTVIGAGISGLLAAYRLTKLGHEVHLFEAESRAGGLIATRDTPYGIAETAAHSLLTTAAVRDLAQDLGVELTEIRPGSKARFIYTRGRLRKAPFVALGWAESLRLLKRIALHRSASESEDWEKSTLEDWADEFIGTEAQEVLLGPFLRGIYAARPSEIGVKTAFPSLIVPQGKTLLSHWRATRRGSSARGQITAPRAGMGELVRALETQLKTELGPRFRFAHPVDRLPPPEEAGNLLICTPAEAAARILARSGEEELARTLKQIRYAPLVTVTAFVEAAKVPRTIRGVGALVPEREDMPCLGILFNSSSFEGRVSDPNRYASFTVMLGGTAEPKAPALSDEEIRSRVRSSLERLLGTQGEPIHSEIVRWEKAIPVYSPELLNVWDLARKTWCSRPGRILFGNYTGQVSIRGMIESTTSDLNSLNDHQSGVVGSIRQRF